jgi:hypothetical protein
LFFVLVKSVLSFQSRPIVRFQKLTEAALTDPVSRHYCRLRPHPSLRTPFSGGAARCFPRDARHNMPTLMTFTDDLENIAEPNLSNAQQNLRSSTPRR